MAEIYHVYSARDVIDGLEGLINDIKAMDEDDRPGWVTVICNGDVYAFGPEDNGVLTERAVTDMNLGIFKLMQNIVNHSDED